MATTETDQPAVSDVQFDQREGVDQLLIEGAHFTRVASAFSAKLQELLGRGPLDSEGFAELSRWYRAVLHEGQDVMAAAAERVTPQV